MIGIRPFRLKDADQIITWCKDESAFYKWSAGILGDYPITIERMIEATSGRIENDSYFPFVAFNENEVIGFFCLRHPNEDKKTLRFGFVILSPSVRGKGYGKEMLRLGMRYAFEIYGVKQVSLGVFENNESAYHCYLSAGFTDIHQNEIYEINNNKWNCIEMKLTKEEYIKKYLS